MFIYKPSTKTIFFNNQHEFRAWLEKHHQVETEVLAGYYKVKTGKPSMTWSESVDQAICFGWIDGIRRSIDEESYSIRFTPRKPNSNWSTVNIEKVKNLKQKGLMRQAGLDAFEKRKEEKSGVYSYENEDKHFNVEFENAFKKKLKAWDYFNAQAPSYRKTAIRWIHSAKTEKTQWDRLSKLIEASEGNKRLWGR